MTETTRREQQLNDDQHKQKAPFTQVSGESKAFSDMFLQRQIQVSLLSYERDVLW